MRFVVHGKRWTGWWSIYWLSWYQTLFDSLFLFHATILEPNFHLQTNRESFIIVFPIWLIKALKMFGKFSLTCVSLSCKALAISIRRARVRYLLKWNSFSNSVNCLFVKFVRAELLLFPNKIALLTADDESPAVNEK